MTGNYCKLFRNPYTIGMETNNVFALHEPGSELRRARGAFVKSRLDDDGRSARYVAGHVGISNTAFSDRLKGKAPFIADELETIAYVLKIDPVDFYRDYIAVGLAGFEPTRITVEDGWLAPVTPIRAAA